MGGLKKPAWVRKMSSQLLQRWWTSRASKEGTKKVIRSLPLPFVLLVTRRNGLKNVSGLIITQSSNTRRQTFVAALQPVYFQLTDTPQPVGFSK